MTTLQELTRDRGALVTAIRRAVADGQTALYTAVYVALRQLSAVTVADQGEGIRRRVLVVLSDGKDNASVVGYGDVLDAASRSDTVIYSIALRALDLFDSSDDDNSIFLLRQLAERTGGRVFVVRDAQELTDVYRRIHEELQHQVHAGLCLEAAARRHLAPAARASDARRRPRSNQRRLLRAAAIAGAS